MENELVNAVEAIKTAILNSQYEAAKSVNRVQLSLYYGIGRFLSANKGKKTWGSGFLEKISEQLRKELPGLRGFSAENLKKMRQFYEAWDFLETPNSSVASDELPPPQIKSSVVTDDFQALPNSTDVIADLPATINSGIAIPDLPAVANSNSVVAIPELTLSGVNLEDFPVEDFVNTPFSHHIKIFQSVKNLAERYYYIHRVAEEHLSVDALSTLIKTAWHARLTERFVRGMNSYKEEPK